MNQEPELIVCARCKKVREKFLVGCPQCGTIEHYQHDPNRTEEEYTITLDVIRVGAEYYKRNFEEGQKAWFKKKIPNGQSWQFYAGILLASKLSLIWLKELLPMESYSDPITLTNARVYYLMSFMTKEKQQLFCDLLNRKEKNVKDNIQRETVSSDDKSS